MVVDEPLVAVTAIWSGLIAAGCDLVTVRRALGNADATVTLNMYAHLWPTAEDRSRAAKRPCSPRR